MSGTTRERALVGLFVIIAAGLLFGTALLLTGGFGNPQVPHHSYFKFAGGLNAGAAVRYGGLSVGKVTKVHVDPTDSTRIEVEYAVDPGTPLRTDSVARVTSLGLLGDNYLEVAPGSKAASLAPGGSVIASKDSFGFDEIADAAQVMLPEVQKTLGTLNEDLDGLQTTIKEANDLLNDKNRATINSVLANLDGALKELRPALNDTLKQVSAMLNDAQPKLSATLTDVQSLVKKMDPLLDNIDKTVTTANTTLGHVDGLLVDDRKTIDASLASLQSVLDKSNVLVGQINSTLSQNSDNLDESLDNFRLVTENLRQLTDMLKTSPTAIIRGTNIKDRKPGGGK